MEQEQIIRAVTPIGNGAHIFAPKEWIGEEVMIVRPPKKLLKEKILETLEPYLEHIKGTYLYGSRARGEEEKDSDIDLFLITSKPLKIKKKSFEIIAIEENKIKDAIKVAPIMIYSILAEAKPIINENLLQELRKKYKPKEKDFKEFLNSTKRIININEELLKLEEDSLESTKQSYSIILRLRGIYIIKMLLKQKTYSHKGFRSWIEKSIKDIDYNSIYEAYRKIKSNLKIQKPAKSSDLKALLNLLKQEILNLENYGKKKKKT